MVHDFARQILNMQTTLSPETKALIDALPLSEREFGARESVYHAGDKVESIAIARSGWFASSIELRDGGRQLLNFFVPVDIMGLDFMMTDEAPTGLTALSPSKAAFVPRDAFLDIMRSDRTLTTQIVSLLGLQDVLMQERLCAMSRMNARDKIAYFLLLLRSKVNAKHRENASIIRFPLTQTDIADSLGLTNVTVSRTITELEKAGYVKYARNIVEFLNPDTLAAEVAFTDRYAKFNANVTRTARQQLAA